MLSSSQRNSFPMIEKEQANSKRLFPPHTTFNFKIQERRIIFSKANNFNISSSKEMLIPSCHCKCNSQIYYVQGTLMLFIICGLKCFLTHAVCPLQCKPLRKKRNEQSKVLLIGPEHFDNQDEPKRYNFVLASTCCFKNIPK